MSDVRFRDDHEALVWAQFAASVLPEAVSHPIPDPVTVAAMIADTMLEEYRKRGGS